MRRMSLICLLGMASLMSAARAEDRPLRIVTTVTDLRDLAREAGGDLVEVESLVPGPQDPHFVDPRPSYVVRLRDADLFVVNGLELEKAWIAPLLDNARNARILPGGEGYVDASAGIVPLELPTAGTTRASGDVHALGNPHYLLDPLNGWSAARTIGDAIVRMRPGAAAEVEKHLADFRRRLWTALFGADLVDEVGGTKLERLAREGRLDAFLAETKVGGKPLSALLGGWLGRLRPLKGRAVITYHKSFSYFVDRFGLTVADFVEPLPGIPPTPKHLVDLLETIRSRGVQALLTHPFYDDKAPGMLAEKTGIRVLVLPAAVEGVPGVDHYLDVAETIVRALETAHGLSGGTH